MSKREEPEYFNDEQLRQLIEDAEQDLHQAPDYLKQMILRKAEPEFVKKSVEIVPIRHALREGQPLLPQKTTKKKQLRIYRTKIIAAAAAAIALVMLTPNANQFKEVRQEPSVMQNINQKTTDFCSAIYEKTNQLFQKGEK